MLDAYDALNNEQHANEETEGAQVQLSLKQELDRQVQLRKSIEAKQKAEEVQYYKDVYQEVQDFHKSEKQKAKEPPENYGHGGRTQASSRNRAQAARKGEGGLMKYELNC